MVTLAGWTSILKKAFGPSKMELMAAIHGVEMCVCRAHMLAGILGLSPSSLILIRERANYIIRRNRKYGEKIDVDAFSKWVDGQRR